MKVDWANFFSFDKDSGYYSQKVEVVDGICWHIKISHVARCLFVSCEVGCGNRALKLVPMISG